MLSIAEAFEKKGILEGQRKFLQRQLVAKFGPLSDHVLKQLQEASDEQLGLYAERILDAERIEHVFE